MPQPETKSPLTKDGVAKLANISAAEVLAFRQDGPTVIVVTTAGRRIFCDLTKSDSLPAATEGDAVEIVAPESETAAAETISTISEQAVETTSEIKKAGRK